MYDNHIAVAIKPLALIKWCYVNSYGTRALTAMAGAMNEEFGRVLQIQMVLPFIHCQGTQYRQFIIYMRRRAYKRARPMNSYLFTDVSL